ncbi:MAG: hypothetical protein M1820_006887 [Bogoriella megaspora]|nr:MAG: hypothetical protein M1820_006887 [Bogoriella megaspora]
METDSMLSGLSKSFDVLQKRPNNALQANAQIEEHQRRQQSLNFHTLYEFLPPGQRANEPVNAGAAGTGTGDLNFDPNLLSDNVQRSKGSMHHFHVYATKHNTHITLTNPDYAPMLSLSAGNIGFRKAGRGTYDAAYQLAAYTLKTVQEKGMMGKIQTLEVIWRGFGPGREAVGKVLLGSEGRFMRPKIKKATDATRLKFGGTRSPKPRRLG